MYKLAKPLFLMTESSLHAGAGGSLGAVDLPIQRERSTGFPKIESSSLKGSLREALESQAIKDFINIEADYSKIHRTFGYDEGGLSPQEEKSLRGLFIDDNNAPANDFAGSLSFTDGRLLLFPVKSAKGIFAWVTCPMVIQRFLDDMASSDISEDFSFLQGLLTAGSLCLEDNNLWVEKNEDGTVHTALLEEYSFSLAVETGGDNGPLKQLADKLAGLLFPAKDTASAFWRSKLQKDTLLLNDDDYTDFVQLSTEVVTRIKINNQTGTVEQGGLFTEEYLPSECLLYTIVQAAPELNRAKGKNPMSESEVMGFFHRLLPKVFQLGGNVSLGKGILRNFNNLLS